jgi:hypothetical protein
MSREQVLKWLNETGFPLEMAAASAFRQAGFEVQQSATYVDLQSEKGREIDVLARDPDIIGFIELSVVVECKSSTKPWVVLTSNDALAVYNRLRTGAVMSERTYTALSRGRTDNLKVDQYLHRAGKCGYGFRQAFSKDADPGYGAAMNVVSACKGITSVVPAGDDWPTLAASIPIIVVDSPLFECQLRPDGELELVEVDASAFLFSAHIPKQVSCVVRVIHRSKLEVTAKWAKSLVDALREDLKPEEDKFFKESSRPKE